MKSAKKWVSVMLALCCLCSSTAYAAGTDQQMTLVYTQDRFDKSETDTGRTDSSATVSPGEVNETTPTEPDYYLVIPESLTLQNEYPSTVLVGIECNNYQQETTITAYIDGTRTFEDDGYIHMTAEKSNDEIVVMASKYNGDSDSYNQLTGNGLIEIVQYNPGGWSNVLLQFEPLNGYNVANGVYYGTVYFVVSMSN